MIREESIRISFNYAAGGAGSRALVALRDDQRLLGSHCPDCERTMAPARSFCPTCGAEDLADVELGPGAELISITETAQGLFALVRPHGADTAMVQRLIGDADDFSIGDRLRPVFAADRVGHIADLAGFAPEDGDRP